MIKNHKKAQVTVFIILGLIILLVTGILIYFSTEVFKYAGLDEQFVPVAKYTEQCIEDVASQGIFLAGMQGGYIYPPYEEDEAYLNTGFPVTYWFLAGEDRSVTILKLESDLELYLKNNLNNCLNNYAEFSNEFEITDLNEEDLAFDVDIEAKEVNIASAIPVQISDSSSTATMPELKISFDNTIGNKIFLAYKIMKAENEDGFLEFYTNEIIAASAWLPYEGFDFTCRPSRWRVDEMKDYIQQAVAVNIPFLMFKGTDYEKTGDLYYDKIYLVDVGASGVKDLQVRTSYNPRWNMDLDVNPSKNGVVTDIKMVGQTIAIPCIKVFHHKYTVYYPILFEINDEENSNYPFFFATPVIMTRNEPDRYAEMEPWPSETDAIRNAEFCSETTKITNYSLNADGSITTEETELPSWTNSLDVIAMDSLYGFDQILEDVEISYRCGRFQCEIGATEYGSGNILVAYPLLSSTFPDCLNGVIIAGKEGYQKTELSQTVSENTDGSTINLEMHRLEKLDFDVTAVVNHNNIIEQRELDENELAVITLTNQEQNFEKVMIYPTAGEDAEGFDKLELLVADGITYYVDIKLIDEDIYTGGFVYNWTPDANAITSANSAHFYVIKKDILLATDENYREAMQYAEEESINYPPELS